MNSPCYAYILNQWKIGAVDEAWVKGRVPKFITQAECDTILATPQEIPVNVTETITE